MGCDVDGLDASAPEEPVKFRGIAEHERGAKGFGRLRACNSLEEVHLDRVRLGPFEGFPNGHGYPTSRDEHSCHLAKRCTSIREEHQAELADDCVEGAFVVGEGFCNTFLPSDTRFEAFGYYEHPGIRIDASHESLRPHTRRSLPRENPRPARHVEHAVAGANLRDVHDTQGPLLE